MSDNLNFFEKSKARSRGAIANIIYFIAANELHGIKGRSSRGAIATKNQMPCSPLVVQNKMQLHSAKKKIFTFSFAFVRCERAFRWIPDSPC